MATLPTQPEDRYRLLASLARGINSSLDVRKVFWRAAEALRELTGCQRAGLRMLERVSDFPDYRIDFGPPVRWSNSPRSARDEIDPATRWAAEHRQGRVGLNSDGTWVADLPLVCRERVIGVVQIETPVDRPIKEYDLAYLLDFSQLLAIGLDNALAYSQANALKKQLERENVYLKDELGSPGLIGDGRAMREVRKAIGHVAATDSNVLILGETGTGKELIARAIHEGSSRRGQLLVKVNCGALTPNLITSELFGHEPGAFTGATRRRQGRFELAHRGTIFLDEIAEIPPEAQVLLLRVLQERVIERVGGNRSIPTDVRVIAATHRDLAQAVADNRFRADLFYRLNVFPIRVPPLRERREDIPTLAAHFVDRLGRAMNKPIRRVSAATLELLRDYHWPGNVRELENIIERAMIVASGEPLEVDPAWLTAPRNESATGSLAHSERQTILAALLRTGGQVYGPAGAAAALGLKPTTLYGKMRKHQIRKKAGSTQFE